MALKVYIIVTATERATTDSFWENRMSNPNSKPKGGTFTVIRSRFLCEDMGHDSSSSASAGTRVLHQQNVNWLENSFFPLEMLENEFQAFSRASRCSRDDLLNILEPLILLEIHFQAFQGEKSYFQAN